MRYSYEEPWAAAVNTISSFAKGWATMKFQIDQQNQAEERWDQQWKLQKDQMSQQLNLTNRQHNLEWTKWQSGEELRKANTLLVQKQSEVADWNFDMKQKVQEETAQANTHMFSLIPSLLNTKSEDVGKAFIQNLSDAQRSFPNADMTSFTNIAKIMFDSKLLGGTSAAKMAATTHDYVNPKGEDVTRYFYTDGTTLGDLPKGTLSEGVRTLVTDWRKRLQTRRDERMKAFSEGRTAKFGGEINISISDLNDLKMNFHEIVSYADQLTSWLEKDPKKERMRTEFNQSLKTEIPDDKARLQVVESMFGPTPTIKQEVQEQVVGRYSKIYEDRVRKRIQTETELDGVVYFGSMYRAILVNSEGEGRDWHRLALMSAAQRVLSPSEYESFLDEMDFHAQEYMKGIDQGRYIDPSVQEFEPAEPIRGVEKLRMELNRPWQEQKGSRKYRPR